MHRLVLIAVLLVSGRAHAGGGFSPPLEIEVGTVDQAGDRSHPEMFGTQMLIGLSWASLYPRPTPIDVTLGFEAIVPYLERPAVRPDLGEKPARSEVGGYLDVGVALDAMPHLRTFTGFRGELLHGDRRAGAVYGGAFRLSVELWKGTRITGPGGGIIGTVALAVWSEVGMRQRRDGSSGELFACGVGIRLPLIVATH